MGHFTPSGIFMGRVRIFGFFPQEFAIVDIFHHAQPTKTYISIAG